MKTKDAIYKALALTVFLGACSSNNYKPEEPAELVPIQKATAKAEVDWEQSVGSGVGSYFSKLGPAIGEGVYFAADRESVVSAFDHKTGEKIWTTDILDVVKAPALKDVSTARIASGITYDQQKVFVGSEHGLLVALDAGDGKLLWSQTFATELLSKPLVASNHVIVHTSSGAIFSFDTATGEKQWEFFSALSSLTLRGTSEPSSEYGGVFIGTAEGRLICLNLNNGQANWFKQVSMPEGSSALERMIDIDAKAVVIEGTLYALGFNGHLSALDIRSGAIKWKREYSGFQDFTIVRQTLFFVNDKDIVIAVDRQTGQELWRNKQLKLRRLTAPAAAKGVVAVGDYEGYVHLLDQRTGSIVGRVRVDGSGLIGQPLITEDYKFLFQSRDGDIARVAVQH